MFACIGFLVRSVVHTGHTEECGHAGIVTVPAQGDEACCCLPHPEPDGQIV